MANSKRSREKEEFWRLVVDEQQRSGLSAREFCEREGLSAPSFYNWKRELRKRDAEPAPDANRPTNGQRQFVPVEVVEQVGDAAPMGRRVTGTAKTVEIVTPGGWTLRFDPDTSPERIGALMDVMTRQSGRAFSC